MGKFALGTGLLAGLLALGLWTAFQSQRLQEPVVTALSQAAEASLAGDHRHAFSLAEEANRLWDTQQKGFASISDHAPMEEIESLFAQLEVYKQKENYTAFAACCAKLSRLVAAIAEAHSTDWWNIL